MFESRPHDDAAVTASWTPTSGCGASSTNLSTSTSCFIPSPNAPLSGAPNVRC